MGNLNILTPQQKRFYGLFSESQSFESNTYSNMFKQRIIPPTSKKTIMFDMKVSDTMYADLKKRGGTGITFLENNYIRVTVTPGEVSARVPLEADDFDKMMAGEVEVLVGGEMIKTPSAMITNGINRLRGGVDRTYEMMCSKAITDGVVVSTDGNTSWTYKLPKIVNKTWNTSGTTGIVKIISDIIREGKKKMGMIPPRIEIGSDIVDRMLADDLFLKQSQALNTGGRTNIANSSVD